MTLTLKMTNQTCKGWLRSRSERNHLSDGVDFDLSGFRGVALNQSQRKRCVYWLNHVWHRRSHSFGETTKCAFLIFCPRESRVLSGCLGLVFDVREGQLQGRLNRWMGHYVLHPPLPSVGSLQAVKSRYASALDRFPLLKTWP